MQGHLRALRTDTHSCSTFLIDRPGGPIIGHNLDDYIEMSGQVIANPRGMSKENISWLDLAFSRKIPQPRLGWVSRYASLSYNAFGREFPDGGLNEAGLYVGEMTLLGTSYPKRRDLPRIYHHHWMQFLIDNFASVDEVLASIPQMVVEGHCQWHFFVADRLGNAAAIEFLHGNTVVQTGETMPVKVLCNAAYAQELARAQEYAGHGGDKPVDFHDRSGPERFLQAAAILRQIERGHAPATVDQAFAILRQLDCGNNKWSLVYDLAEMRLYFRTSRAGDIRWVDLAGFHLSPSAPAMILDIDLPAAGDVAALFQPFDERKNLEQIRRIWDEINMGPIANALLKPMLVRRFNSYPKSFSMFEPP